MSNHIKISNADHGFFQEPPVLKNQYEDDIVLQNILKKTLSKAVFDSIEPDLIRFGNRVIRDIMAMGKDIENPDHYPRLTQYDAWCRRVDEISTAQGWKDLQAISAEEGLVAIAYERKYNEYSRLYQFAKQYLFGPSSSMYSCPLSMTDGAARVIELIGTPEIKETVYPHLISRDPQEFWTSGQWMTERPGGSDIGKTETIAELDESKVWSISGFKWFSSATTADITMLLARSVDPNSGNLVAGTKGLSLFVAKMKTPTGTLNGVRIHRLKNKFGTKGLPTAELELVGMKATMLGQPGRGVPNIASVLNITRIYAAIGVVGNLRRALAIIKDFSYKRKVLEKALNKTPLHVTTLARLELAHRAGMQIIFHCVELLGRTECGKATEEDVKLLRFMTPIAKGYVCNMGMSAMGETMESLGGQGYMEETGIGCLFRDAQVNTIWEGTTNVMSLDVLRVMRETKNESFELFINMIKEKVERSAKVNVILEKSKKAVDKTLEDIKRFVKAAHGQLEPHSRQLTFALGRALAGALLIEQAAFGLSNEIRGADQDVFAAQSWCSSHEFLQELKLNESIDDEARMVYGPNAKI